MTRKPFSGMNTETTANCRPGTKGHPWYRVESGNPGHAGISGCGPRVHTEGVTGSIRVAPTIQSITYDEDASVVAVCWTCAFGS